jgi:hypothetical protein
MGTRGLSFFGKWAMVIDENHGYIYSVSIFTDVASSRLRDV